MCQPHFVHNDIKDEFISRLRTKVATLTVGHGLVKDTDISVLINQDGLDKVLALLKDATDKGATLIMGGDINPIAKLTPNPTIITDISDEMDISHE